MYPVKVSLQMLGHKWYHECKALIPDMDRIVLNDIVTLHVTDGSFTEEEQARNTLKDEIVEWNP
jgi:hypothetical protein